MTLEVLMVNAERCMNVMNIPKESFIEEQLTSRPNWPENGSIQFKDVCLKYRPNLDRVLHELSFSVKPGEKVGVVGRTGAGKSTMSLALSRIIELEWGSIIIDGVDIS